MSVQDGRRNTGAQDPDDATRPVPWMARPAEAPEKPAAVDDLETMDDSGTGGSADDSGTSDVADSTDSVNGADAQDDADPGSPRGEWRHDSGDDAILLRAAASQEKAIRQARVVIGEAETVGASESPEASAAGDAGETQVLSAQDSPTIAVPAPVAPTRTMPTGAISDPGRFSASPAPAAAQADARQTVGPQPRRVDGQSYPSAPSSAVQSPVPQQPAPQQTAVFQPTPQPRQEPPQQQNFAPQPPVSGAVVIPAADEQGRQQDRSAQKPSKTAGPVPAGILLCALLGLLAASLPMTAAISAAVVAWLLGARGRSVIGQYRREQSRGGFRRHGDGAREGLRTPLYLLQALPAALGMLVLWLVFFAVADLLAVGLFSLPSTPLVIALPMQSVSVPLIAGDGIGPGALLLGLAGAGACAVVFFQGGATRPMRLGLSVLWLALQRGLCRIVGRTSRLVAPLQTVPADGVTYPSGYQPYGGDMGYGSPKEVYRRHHSGEILGLILLVLFVTVVILAAVHLSSPVDWTPLVTGTDVL